METDPARVMDASKHPSKLTDRRGILKSFFGVVSLSWMLGLIYPITRFFSPPKMVEAKPIEIPLSQLSEDRPTPVMYAGSPAYVFRKGDDIQVLSLVCTHLQCIVIWDEATQQFHCPCHDAQFSPDGRVLSGPPERPLDAIKITRKNQLVIIGGE